VGTGLLILDEPEDCLTLLGAGVLLTLLIYLILFNNF
jgi:hypothetical protein